MGSCDEREFYGTKEGVKSMRDCSMPCYSVTLGTFGKKLDKCHQHATFNIFLCGAFADNKVDVWEVVENHQ